jgi:hypothetical protein
MRIAREAPRYGVAERHLELEIAETIFPET